MIKVDKGVFVQQNITRLYIILKISYHESYSACDKSTA